MHTARIDSVREFMSSRRLDAFLVTDSPDIRWCCGFTGSAGILLIDQSKATLVTDGRYREQAIAEVAQSTATSISTPNTFFDVQIHTSSPLEHLSEVGLLSQIHSIGVDSWRVTLAFATDFEDRFPDVELTAIPYPLKEAIASKHEREIEALQRAQAMTDAVFEEVLQIIRPGLTEVEVASEIVHRHLMKGAEAMAFPPIVASGPNAALPHARPSDRQIGVGELVVLDFGCFVDGYASYMTRTLSTGQPNPDAPKVYDIVHSAQRKAQDQARPGMSADELDEIGRNVITKAGYGRFFTHSLGHGLGLRVHEWPRIGRGCTDILPENVVITIEPGIYISGSFGIRIENSVLLSSTGSEQLPTSDTSLIVI